MSPTKSGSKSTTRKPTRTSSRSASSTSSTGSRQGRKSTSNQNKPSAFTSSSRTGSSRTSSYNSGNSNSPSRRSTSDMNYSRQDNYSGRGQRNQYGDHWQDNYDRNPRGQNQYASNYSNRNDDQRYDNRYDDRSYSHRGPQEYQHRGPDGRFESDRSYQDHRYQNERNRNSGNRNTSHQQWSDQQYYSNKSYPTGKNEEGLRKLFEAQLKDMYWAEKALTKALPKLIKNTSSEELMNGIEEHLEVTKEQVTKLEEVFQLLGMKAQAKKCEAMEGLIEEANEILSEMEKGPVRDAGIICAAQKVEHYEIATYGCLATYAEMLDEQEAANILHEILEEEKEADENLSKAANTINWEAVEEDDEDENEEEDDEEEEEEDEEAEDEEEGEDNQSAVESTNASPKITSKAAKSSTTKSKS